SLGVCAGIDGDAPALLFCAIMAEQDWQRMDLLYRSLSLEALHPLQVVHYLRSVLAAVGSERFQEALSVVNQGLTRFPESGELRAVRAAISRGTALLWDAGHWTDLMLASSPDSPEALYEAYWTYRNSDRYERARTVLERALSLEQTNAGARQLLVEQYQREERYSEADALLEEGLALDPSNIDLYFSLANIRAMAGDVSGASATLDRIGELTPTSAWSWSRIARLHLRMNRPDEAEEAFEMSARLSPQSRETRTYLTELRQVEAGFWEPYHLDAEALRELASEHGSDEPRSYTVLANQHIAQVHRNGLASVFTQQAYRVNTSAGADQLRSLSIVYTPDEEHVEIIAARVLKSDGTIRQSFDRSEQSMSQPWYGIYYDLRAQVLAFEDLRVGDIVELTYVQSTVSAENMFDSYYGDLWFTQDVQPTVFARFGLIHDPDVTFYMRTPTLPYELTESEIDGETHLIYTLNDLPAIEDEAYMPGLSSVADYIHVSTFDSWESVGRWYWNLIQGQLVLSPRIRETVEQLIEGRETTAEKVAAIHEY
ncbi:MAG: DUF3857 domain-containing protein, partial [Myxococcales bacterium]|nr:DUF3857 domain-containing protein [Myxococcales bacterium]